MSRIYYKTSKDFLEPDDPPHEEGVDMIWEITQYSNSASPDVWGPAFWFSLHNGAVRYPIKASPVYAERMKGFILGIPVMIPCDSCRDHATAYIEKNYSRLNEIVSGMHNLFNFFVDFHNYVNRRYNKFEMSYEDAYKLYTKNANVTKLVYRRKYA
jgi:Erv1 / Alr family